MKNNFDFLDDQGFDLESLHPGEIGVECEKFTERDNKGEPIIELQARIFWAADEENQDHVDKTFKWVIFFGKNNDQTPRILKDVFKRAGFQTSQWNEDGLPLRIALPGAIKLLVYKHVPLIGKVNASTRNNSTRNFFNPLKIVRENPNDGRPYEDALPDPVPNELVKEAYHAVLEGDSVEGMV